MNIILLRCVIEIKGWELAIFGARSQELAPKNWDQSQS